ncbi:glucose-1-phosphate adenylyltransferase [Alkalihalobacterium chitinilyticum]|uniref:Glucose-1-phosphate adenylyltransferase n=1 Tax=Alkalihalobacterium chitinilyticum TaxID=2980103 RepID=A0ABT5VHH9_9BACI|nr:glucose-1-phosphate adenylyltransferase [Alkalihalobacterium chitinilyticum]MDE5414903.1 glucose-1-phosphate adenylyltransferase [Alkalihalobacterium chitinilyticum]
MKQKKECVGMLLAGGEGKRLGLLTKKIAKPAVYFGGKYRIIDFTLSNCTNSGIDTVGVLTQYEPLALNTHLGIGSPWDLDRRNGGLSALPPFIEKTGGSWYKGTADAIYQNINFIEQYDPEYVLIISGDHIYKMNYAAMLDFHKKNNADATISVIEVPWDEASRFGIMNTDDNYVINEFEEKPENPKNNLASMGIYIFNWKALKSYLIEDSTYPYSSNDFGKDIIPKMLEDGKNMVAFPFRGYWKDVGTVKSFWEANMDLLRDSPSLQLSDPNWKIYSVNPNQPPQYIAPTASIECSMINEGCLIYGSVYRSILFYGVEIQENSQIKDSVIMPNVTVGKNVTIERAIINDGTIIPDNVVIKPSTPKDIVVIDKDTVLSDIAVVNG